VETTESLERGKLDAIRAEQTTMDNEDFTSNDVSQWKGIEDL